MKKTLPLVLILIMAVSVIGFANTEDELIVDVSTEDVGHMEVVEESVNIDITQDMLAREQRYLTFYNSFTLRVAAITDWKVNISAEHCLNTGTSNDPAEIGALMIERMNGNYFRASNSENKVAWGSNNMGNTYARKHNLRIDLKKLGDQIAGNNQTITPGDGFRYTNIEQWVLDFSFIDTTANYNPPNA